MAVVVGTSLTNPGTGGAAVARGQSIRGLHFRAVQSNEHYARAKLRTLWTWGDGIGLASTSYGVIASEVPIHLSLSSTANLLMEVIGTNCRVQVVEAAAGPGGIVTIPAGPTSAVLGSPFSGGGIASDTTTYIRIAARVDTAGVGQLYAVRLYEVPPTSANIT